MRLNLHEIIHVPGASIPFDFEMDMSEQEFYGNRPAKKPLRVRGQVRNAAGALHLEGSVTGTLNYACDRCGSAFVREVSIPLDTLLAAELEEEEHEEIVLLDGDELDLAELASTAFILSMDMKNLCSETCKGLCPGCGVNLNEEACRCKPEVDPRLAALGQLLDT